MKPYKDRCYIVLILYTIIRAFCGNSAVLCVALGKKGSKNDLQWLRLLANDMVWTILPSSIAIQSGDGESSRKKSSPALKSSATVPTASVSAEELSTSVQDSIISPRIVPIAVSFEEEKENRTSPLTVSSDSPVLDMVEAPLESTPPNSEQSFSAVQETPLSSGQPTPAETPGTQVKKRVCLGPTPVLSPVLRRALFIPPSNQNKTPEQTNDDLSPECSHFKHAISTAQNDKDLERRALEFVCLRAADNGNLLDKRIYALPSRSVCANTSGRNRRKFVNKAAASVMDFIQSTVSGAASDTDLQKTVLERVIKSKFDSIVCSEPKAQISSMEVLEIRNRSGWNVSTSVVTSIVTDVLTLLKKKKMLISAEKALEGQLKKKIGLLERVSAVPSKFKYVECCVTKEDVERCVYYYIENVPLLMERLVSGCVLEGEMEDSLAFSKFKNKVIFRFGADRGGSDLIMMISLANRKKGNHGRFSIPIGVVEGATEVYSKLEKTLYSPNRKAILEQLVNQQLFMIRIQFFSKNDTSAAAQDVKCLLLQFVGRAKRQDLSSTKIVCTIGGIEYLGIPHTQMPLWKSRALGRVIADDAFINQDLCFLTSNGELHLKVRLLQSQHHFIGCRVQIAATMEEIFSFEFDQGVNTEDIDLNSSMVDCLQLIGVPCEDGKMCTTVYGLSTCGSSYPCPKCLWPLREVFVPTWVRDHIAEESNTDTADAVVSTKDYTERTGKYSRNESYYHFSALAGDMTCDPTLKLKKDVFSVIYKLLLHIDDDLLYLHTGDPMHVSQGLMTHLTEETAIQLQKATEESATESEPEFIKDQTTKVKAFIEVMGSRASSLNYQHAQNRYKEEDCLVKLAFENLLAAEDEDDTDRCYVAYTEAVMRRDEVGEELGYQETLRKLNGADELKSLLQTFERSKKKNFTKAVFLFMKAIKTFAGDFNKNHGQCELTNARGIKALQSNEEIYNVVINGCNDPVVLEIMAWWHRSANLLLQISSALKSQDMQCNADILKLKENVANFVQQWIQRLGMYEKKNPIYWKMHMLLCALIRFIEKTGMSGRCSTEGFENKHHVMNQIKRLMAPIAQDKLRCEKLSQRQQSCLIPGIEEVHCLFEEEDYKRRRSPQGRYNSFGTRTKLLEDLPIDDETDLEAGEAVEGYFDSKKNNLIPNELQDVYNYMLLGKVPDGWSKTFIDSEFLGSKASNSARYIPP